MHRLALKYDAVAETSFDLEQLLHPVAPDDAVHRPHVFVAGLARAGTTILMRTLYETGEFCSLTYRHMPFLLAPNTWARFSSRSRKDRAAVERAHGDGLFVDFDSPEALEEVFWRVLCQSNYIHDDMLYTEPIDDEVIPKFRAYVSLILKGSPTSRYLSKNNNNILRLNCLRDCFPDATIIIPFRDPVQHAQSLLLQHRQFKDRQVNSPFVRDYMSWLVHYEFGEDHRPFVFGKKSDIQDLGGDDATIEYWMRLWLYTYKNIVETAPSGTVYVAYERFCDNRGSVWPKLCSALQLSETSPPIRLRRSDREIDLDLPENLKVECNALYKLLCDLGA